MTLDASYPKDQTSIDGLPAYIRENRVAINAQEAGEGFGYTAISLNGETSLTVGSDLEDVGLEIIKVTGTGATTLATILGGTSGQVKIFIFSDSNVDITDGNDKGSGKFFLNHLPAGSNFAAEQDDVLAVVNIGGDGGSTYGYWMELYRTLSLK